MGKKYMKLAVLLLAVVTVITVLGFTMQEKDETTELWGMADAKEVNVNSKVSGRVVKICVKEGEQVEAGQILAYIDRDNQDIARVEAQAAIAAQLAQLEQANIMAQNSRSVLDADLAKAKSDYDTAASNEARYRSLLASGAVSAQVYESYHNQLRTAQSALASAEANLLQNDVNEQSVNMHNEQLKELRAKLATVELSKDETVIRAPSDGIITKSYLEEGELVSPTVPLFSLQDPYDNWVDFKVKETELSKYALDQEVMVRGRDGETELVGHIVNISHKPEYATIKATSERGEKDITAFNVKVQLDSDCVRPGMRFRLERE